MWNIINSAGSLTANIILPRDDGIVAYNGALVVTLGFSELDVPLLRVYRVQP